ncbi:SGNH hydrolase-type esterase domain-containing protein [Mycena maculata]|uniref:SGNH hydrolase-type esterase domain-containing protein n=1 Tax=Mycena maculata TaxID=230809 RepID=A0AAD7K5J1_9AGAR|nr:SGNH hydrolase-type esterase domain-containing protein [Mycena maculata]
MAAKVQDVIMLFGDSITQVGWSDGGFGARLQHVYSRRLDVLNRGFGGYNTDWAIPILEQCLATQDDQQYVPKIRILVFWFGANDACAKPSPQHVPLPKFIENIKHAVGLIQSAESPYYSPSTKIILVTPPPVNTYQLAPELSDRTFDTTKEYADGVKAAAMASESKVSVVDAWTAIWKAAGEREGALSKYLSDGLHLSPDGYTVVYEALIETIKVDHPSLHYENLQPVFPPWAGVDRANPGPSVQKKDIFK